jgi:hypothetical protein
MPSRLAEHLSTERHRQFVGRGDELALFQSALAAAELPFFVLHVVGPGGVGKTALLGEFVYLCEQAQKMAIYVSNEAGIEAISVRKVSTGAKQMKAQSFYLCPVCFEASEFRSEFHPHPMMRYQVGEPGDERRKPATDEHGTLKTRAPRWFLETASTPTARLAF